MLTADTLQSETLHWNWIVKHIQKHVIQNMIQRIQSKESKQSGLMEEQFAEAVTDSSREWSRLLIRCRGGSKTTDFLPLLLTNGSQIIKAVGMSNPVTFPEAENTCFKFLLLSHLCNSFLCINRPSPKVYM